MQKSAWPAGKLLSGGYISGWSALRSNRHLTKALLTMKLTIFLITGALMNVYAAGISQTVTFSGTNVPIKKVFSEVEKQTGFVFMYTKQVISDAKPVSISVKNVPIQQMLQDLFKGQPLEFNISGKSIFISAKREAPLSESLLPRAPANSATDLPPPVKGIIRGNGNAPLQGASVKIKGSNKGTSTDVQGRFSIEAKEGDVLVITYIGYATQEYKIKDISTSIEIRLAAAETKLDDVVITGMGFNRQKTSFTGSASTFSGEQLKTIGNKNILESLKTLDPAFVMVQNNLAGSNPNRLPTIEIRGKTSINISTTDVNDQFKGDPNQPLFILDGFETTLQVINDLDINRVASVTLLKDAASTALYGSRAANGVVVVETKRPEAGQVRISYSADYSFDIPDFSSYNLMNAEEKLEFERLSGMYYKPDEQWAQDSIYYSRLKSIRQGVNTYWLSEPVHTGISQRHSLRIAGGSNELLFGAGVNYRNQGGVMKGSDRDTWGANFDLNYRKRNFNISNSVNISNLKANESPYGSFSNFSRAVPYYPKYNADGSIPTYLSPNNTLMPNPLYNASLFRFDRSKGLQLRNNMQANYTVSNNLRVSAGLSLSQDNSTIVRFVPPDDISFINIEPFQKGSYFKSQTEGSAVSANLMIAYAKVIGKHQFNANLRGDIATSKNSFTSFEAVGFPFGTNGNPVFSYSYKPTSRPASSAITSRSAGGLVSANYAYDQRFLIDATYRLDGSSVFGSNKQFQPFLSGGIGWNISRERFMQHLTWINMLKLRANAGYTGNQNLGSFTSTSVYTYFSGANTFGQGLDMTSLGNPNLDWQTTLQKSYGLDFTFLNNRVSGSLEYFDKLTSPMIVTASGTIPSSAGVNTYSLNIGELRTTGYAFNVRVSPVYNLAKRIVWTIGVSGQANKSTYGGFGANLKELNDLQLTNNSLVRFSDGNSPDDIWAVLSRGIDPATGSEIFQKKNGVYTFVYSTDDIVKVGNSRPKVEGIINTSVTYKNFTFGANLRYRIGGNIFNSALYQKVENISANSLYQNQDKRALYNRWQKPGDIAEFKAISLVTTTPMSSRFVQKDNHVVGESINAGWRVSNGWIRKLKLQSLSFNVYVNEIFRIESVQTERGIDYPFARSASFSLNANF